jgi:hypothetical protein
MKRLLGLLFLWMAMPAAWGHVGSKDVYETVHAGPYTLYVTVRPPNVIPGVATVEVRSDGAAIASLRVTPLPVTGEAAKHPPAADVMVQSSADPLFYTGAVWMMAGGTWQVRFDIDGAAGKAQGAVPVVAVPLSVMQMDRGMGSVLALLGLFLAVSFAGIVAASVREARLSPGVAPGPVLLRMGRVAIVGGLVFAGMAVALGGWWWTAEASDYGEHVYRATPLEASLRGNELTLTMAAREAKGRTRSPGPQPKDNFLLDHGKVMHLYAIRWPEMDVAFHLHPAQVGEREFRDALPALPPGHYQLYGDVVHQSGFPETLVTTVDVPAGMAGRTLDADDASAVAGPVSTGEMGTSFKLPDGYTMVWDEPAALVAKEAYGFRFRLVDRAGKPAADMQPYLGMGGHAAFVKTDGTVFAHTHPEGSAAMADVMLANESMGVPAMAEMATPAKIAAEVTFPYGFPTSGRYRIFIQMKHGAVVETGVFDAVVK